MAALQVALEIMSGVASAGLAAPAFAAVSVTDANGVLVSLDPHNFLFVVIANPAGAPEQMTNRLNTPRGDGFFLFSLFRLSGRVSDVWAAGDYLVGLQVASPVGNAQTVGILHVPVASAAPGPLPETTSA